MAQGWWAIPVWLRLLIGAGVLGGLAFGVPLLLTPHRATPDRWAAASLKTLAAAEADFRVNDRDNNKVHEFWVGDVAGLYTIMPAGSEEKIRLIELSLAWADVAPTPAAVRALAELGARPPTRGYVFRALPQYEDEDGTVKPYDEGNGRNPSRYGFVADPVMKGASKDYPTFLLNQDGPIYKKKLGGKRVDVCPRDPLKAGWSKLE